MIVTTDINAVWQDVKPKIQAIIDRDGDHGFTPDSVRFACYEKKAYFWTLDDFDGFIITKPKVDENCKPVLFIWIGWNGNTPEETYVEHMKEIARAIGAHRIEFHSTRRGFERRGWKVHEIIYRMEV